MQLDANMPSCGPWRLVREIGHGAYGTVHLAERDDGARAAVKVCRRDDIGEERYERELRGARLYSAIPPQEGLVHMRELAEETWGFYAVMDLADDEFGGDAFSGRAASPLAAASAEYRPKTLASVIDGEKALPLGESVKLGIALAKGLAALQRHHLLHRDIKPGNVIYVGRRPVLSDPGLVVEESEAASLVGTPGYVPPENFTAAAGDIYSLGLTLKAASFGRHIEDLDKGPALEADTGTKLFPAWWRILNKATDPTPSRRYQSAKALLKDLESLRRKIVLTPIIGSRVVKVLITVLVLAAITIIVPIVITGRRAKQDLARQAAENKALKDGLARQSAEIKSLKDDLVRQPTGNKAQDVEAAQQSLELEQLRKDVQQLRKVSDEKARVAAQDAWEAVLRNAYRETFDGISEEELSAKVKEARKEIFGDKK